MSEEQKPQESAEPAGVISESELTDAIEQVCNSKAEEFRMLGYEAVTGVEIWQCVSQKYKTIPPLHRVINDVLSLKTNVFMNWLMIRAYTETDSDVPPPPSKRQY